MCVWFSRPDTGQRRLQSAPFVLSSVSQPVRPRRLADVARFKASVNGLDAKIQPEMQWEE